NVQRSTPGTGFTLYMENDFQRIKLSGNQCAVPVAADVGLIGCLCMNLGIVQGKKSCSHQSQRKHRGSGEPGTLQNGKPSHWKIPCVDGSLLDLKNTVLTGIKKGRWQEAAAFAEIRRRLSLEIFVDQVVAHQYGETLYQHVGRELNTEGYAVAGSADLGDGDIGECQGVEAFNIFQ